MNIAIYDHSYHQVTSGGDVIAAEFGHAWQEAEHKVFFHTHKHARDFFLSRGIDAARIRAVTPLPDTFNSVLWASIVHTINGVLSEITRKPATYDIIFASSCMYEDLFPAMVAKIRQPKAKLAVGIYLFPLPPWTKSYGSNMLHRYIFWAMYHSGILLSQLFADMIWTANEIDAHRMLKRDKKALAIRGGVDLDLAKTAKQLYNPYDALSLARFHPQKNPLELVQIWELVTKKLPFARLAICGAGFMEQEIREEILHRKLDRNIHMLPAVDGQQKFNLYSSTKLFVSSAHFDTGNLALDEALACGIPAVLYDTKYQHYENGVAPVPCFSLTAFADTIVSLLTQEKARKALGEGAYKFAQKLSWDTQAKRALDSIS